MRNPLELKELYDQGENISALPRDELAVDYNTPEIIEISYDLQAGSYIGALNKKEVSAHKNAYSKAIAAVVSSLCTPKTILEAGVGEATTLAGVFSYGFDLSWSRIAYARD